MSVATRSLFRAAILTLGVSVVLPAGSALAALEQGAGTGRAVLAAEGESPAIVGPTLGLFKFGTDIGTPIACNLATSYIADGAAELDQNADAAVKEINNGCSTFSTEGTKLVVQGQEASKPLAAVNEFANPAIDQVADSVAQTGTENGEVLAPMGPTIAGLGDTIRFFKGK
ncbi:MAG: hypothetical protein JWN08_310 [Frankiales bacterium]|nr:hypothetical protein [Frankiales bacterium]